MFYGVGAIAWSLGVFGHMGSFCLLFTVHKYLNYIVCLEIHFIRLLSTYILQSYMYTNGANKAVRWGRNGSVVLHRPVSDTLAPKRLSFVYCPSGQRPKSTAVNNKKPPSQQLTTYLPTCIPTSAICHRHTTTSVHLNYIPTDLAKSTLGYSNWYH